MLLLVPIHSLSSLIGNLLDLLVVNLLLLRRYSVGSYFFNWWPSIPPLNPLVTVPILLVGSSSSVWGLIHLLMVELLIVLWVFAHWLTLKWVRVVWIHALWIRSARLWLDRIIKLSWTCWSKIWAMSVSWWPPWRLVRSLILPSSIWLVSPIHPVGVLIHIVGVIAELRWTWSSLIFIIRYTFLKLTISWLSVWIWLIAWLWPLSIWFNLETPVFIPLFEIVLLRISFWRIVVGAWLSSICRWLSGRILHLVHIFFILVFVHRWFLINLLSLLFL